MICIKKVIIQKITIFFLKNCFFFFFFTLFSLFSPLILLYHYYTNQLCKISFIFIFSYFIHNKKIKKSIFFENCLICSEYERFPDLSMCHRRNEQKRVRQEIWERREWGEKKAMHAARGEKLVDTCFSPWRLSFLITFFLTTFFDRFLSALFSLNLSDWYGMIEG